MELILVRHGEPAWASPDGLGRNDPGLTDLGHQQAQAVAVRLADHEDEPAPGPVDVLAVSPTVRTRETVAPIEEALGASATVHPWLHEIKNPPEWEGKPIDQIDAAFREWKGQSLDRMWEGVPGFEPLEEFHARVIGGLHEFLGEHGVTRPEGARLWEVGPEVPQRIVFVAHGGTNSTIIAHLLGIDPEPWEWDRFMMGHASVAVLQTTPMAGAHIWSLTGFGDATHIPVGSRTR